MTNKLFYGDNLAVLRDHIASESVDLVYLDPPFNSNASYAILFKSPDGRGTDAQIEAFNDTWTWGPAASGALMDITQSGNHTLHTLMQAMRTALGENAMMAYLAMMAVRLVELHRVLKPTGSLYLHCDPTASHYLKLVLDAVFGPRQFRNEIVWVYTGPGSPGVRQFLRKHDTIFWYSKGDSWTFNVDDVRQPHSEKTKANYKGGLIGSGFVGADHVIHEKGKVPEDWWQFAIAPRGREYLGYPTQKPIKLLERIVTASSNVNEVVLDPFCGCGTAIDAAQKLGREWIGIDVTHLAIGLVEKRLRDGYGDAAHWETIGAPQDLASAQKLAADDPHQFQQWICWQLGGFPQMKKGGDKGVDGYFYYLGEDGAVETGVIEVKAGENVNPAMVRGTGRVMQRDGHKLGLFVTAAPPTRGMEQEAASHGLVEVETAGRVGVPERFSALQIFTLADLFRGLRPKLPPLVSPSRRAPRAETRASHKPGAQGDLI